MYYVVKFDVPPHLLLTEQTRDRQVGCQRQGLVFDAKPEPEKNDEIGVVDGVEVSIVRYRQGGYLRQEFVNDKRGRMDMYLHIHTL
jgi:hypothetical protein